MQRLMKERLFITPLKAVPREKHRRSGDRAELRPSCRHSPSGNTSHSSKENTRGHVSSTGAIGLQVHPVRRLHSTVRWNTLHVSLKLNPQPLRPCSITLHSTAVFPLTEAPGLTLSLRTQPVHLASAAHLSELGLCSLLDIHSCGSSIECQIIRTFNLKKKTKLSDAGKTMRSNTNTSSPMQLTPD